MTPATPRIGRKEMTMNRRKFLTCAGGFGGYSLMVKVDGLTAAPASSEVHKAKSSGKASGARRLADPAEPNMHLEDMACDVFIAGGGMAGVCAALAAARNGANVILVQDRSRLGGNSSSEVKMHIVGANNHNGRPGWREGGILEELRLDDAVNNPHRSWELWDLLLYDKLKSESNITLLLDTVLFAAATENGNIQNVLARCDKTEHLFRIRADIYLDCTGDSRLALESGAEFRWGRETKDEFNESLGLTTPDRKTLGSSILFTARDYGRPIPFTPPAWARKIQDHHLKYRPIRSWEYGYWWIEWGGAYDTIRDNELIRFECLAIVTGVWDYIKNSGKFPSAANWGMDWVGMIPGKRESRRMVGDHVLTQNDLEGKTGDFEDAVAIGGWNLDDHPPRGFDDYDTPPFRSIRLPDVYNIPLRSLYSRNIRNLMMAGRNLSASHVAFSSTRVMGTCSVAGQAAGTAAALCSQFKIIPRELYQNPTRRRQLQQSLLRDDQTIKGLQNSDPGDKARHARVTASSEFPPSKAVHVIDGITRDMSGEWIHRWGAAMQNNGAWLQLDWPQPELLRQVQITFDSGFHRELTLSASDSTSNRVIRAPQPETVRDYTLTGYKPNGNPIVLAAVTRNHQRLRRHNFPPESLQAVRLHIHATNGSETARVYELRCY